jgi:sensor c-di-GMP phosphodiesterase-like protein
MPPVARFRIVPHFAPRVAMLLLWNEKGARVRNARSRASTRPFRGWRHIAARVPRLGFGAASGAASGRGKLFRVVIAGVAVGGPLALGCGILVVARAEKARVGVAAEGLISAVRAREAEVTGVLETLDRLQTTPCSAEDLAKLRSIVVGSTIIHDIVRGDHGRLACSAVFGVADISIPDLGKPGFALSADQTIWRDAVLPAVPGRRFTIVGHGNAYVVVLPSLTPPDVTPGRHRVSRFFINRASRQIMWFAGQPLNVSPALLVDGSRFWHDGSYVTVACATDRMMCLVVQSPWLTLLRRNAAGFEMFALAGCLSGSAGSLMLLAWLQDRRSILRRLRRALRRSELVLHYQPILDAKTAQVVGAEALMRWPAATGAAIGPDQFIPIAEDAGMICDLTCFAIRRVSEDLGSLLRFNPTFTVSINIVADDLHNERFHAALAAFISAVGILPPQIALELTERRAAEVEAANVAINRLRQAGYKIYIDDFGTGFSSLTYLSDLAIDAIKLDKSFTGTVNTEMARARLVPPILEMAKDVGVPVIVEGVETECQAAYFRAHGVLGMQGYLFSKPVEAPQLLQGISKEGLVF